MPFTAHFSRKNSRSAAWRASALAFVGVVAFSMQPGFAQSRSAGATGSAGQEAVDAARQVVQEQPASAKARYQLGRALRLAGKNEEAASELLEASSMDPSLYVAYHELSLTKCRPQQIDEAVDRLTILKDEKPKDLLLRVALSELLEAQGKTYQASRVLVDLVYANAVPEKYVARINARIHYLLGKGKDLHASEKVASEEAAEDESLPPPLPEASLRRNLSASKIKDAKSTHGFGHTQLLP